MKCPICNTKMSIKNYKMGKSKRKEMYYCPSCKKVKRTVNKQVPAKEDIIGTCQRCGGNLVKRQYEGIDHSYCRSCRKRLRLNVKTLEVSDERCWKCGNFMKISYKGKEKRKIFWCPTCRKEKKVDHRKAGKPRKQEYSNAEYYEENFDTLHKRVLGALGRYWSKNLLKYDEDVKQGIYCLCLELHVECIREQRDCSVQEATSRCSRFLYRYVKDEIKIKYVKDVTYFI